MQMINSDIKNLLPSDYWSGIDSQLRENKLSNNVLPSGAVIIPSFGEEDYIEKTLSCITQQGSFEKLMAIVVWKQAREGDRTPGIISKFGKDLRDRGLLISIDEAKIPGSNCIGHGRAIGFATALRVGENLGVRDFSKFILFSMDADTIRTDPDYLKKNLEAYSSPATKVVSCENILTQESSKAEEINFLKKIEDGFFKLFFKEIGAVNGRCYSLRGSTYIESGGVDYLAKFEDIKFGVQLHNLVGAAGYTWIDSYVVTSDRRFVKSLESESLMSLYGSEPMGLVKKNYSGMDSGKKTHFYINHLNEGFNTLLFYFTLRNGSRADLVEKLIESFNLYLSYLNSELPGWKIKAFNMDYLQERYLMMADKEPSGEWWREPFKFELVTKNG